MESQVHSMGETIKRLNKQGEACMTSNLKDAPLLQKRLQELNQGQRALLKKAAERRLKLEEARDLFQFEVDMEEEEAWVIEKQRICLAGVIAKDIGAVISLQQKHKVRWCCRVGADRAEWGTSYMDVILLCYTVLIQVVLYYCSQCILQHLFPCTVLVH
ncbi:Spectrin alpha chain, non-erythrocytic 1 [Portunus trituberculatus]|uniref:Spectrin alpha chain, non-erythrocytic 1 n=1 Tax=Portunus trituberculatus TaxID=210409 RepID=A0A5B7J7A3_PORTR|nr:Spectrin alpha chain, non-erythrocytic 1 [Portunus trituberculatus]